ncbi:TetR/AcrR family transcriptional regulator [Chryseobacterium taklimakanense]|uniref:TetR/AcrR family transcriptional regulator n=1 Tax=Chryseobacterium taklimakanense TaxID=536441 RepID=UPI0023F7833D|nr:TetR/AcrR family transcriptional regulator [Chryseobacterium taklimakanense]
MAKKIIKGPVRDKEKTKERLLAAVGKIIQTTGYQGLKVSAIAKEAGCDKKLIYDYYGSTEDLITEYVRQQDYWNKVGIAPEYTPTPEETKEFTKELVLQQYEMLRQNKELQKIILWELSEENYILRQLADEREKQGELLFQHLTDDLFKDSDVNLRAIIAILISGSYYLNLHTEVNGSTFCGIYLKTKDGREEIQQALKKIIEWTFENN